jgi:hypothetical protein
MSKSCDYSAKAALGLLNLEQFYISLNEGYEGERKKLLTSDSWLIPTINIKAVLDIITPEIRI